METVMYILLAAGLFTLGIYGKIVRIRSKQKDKPKKKKQPDEITKTD